MRILAVIVFAFACGKSKDEPPASTGSSSGSGAGSAAVSPTPQVQVALPEVAAHGFTKSPPPARVSATQTQIVVDGKPVLALEAGVPPATAVSGEQLPAIVAGLSATGAATSPDGRMVLALDKQLSYGLLFQLLVTLKSQGIKQFGVLAKAGADTVMLPIDLPDKIAMDDGSMSRRRPGADLDEQLKEVKEAGSGGPAPKAERDPPGAAIATALTENSAGGDLGASVEVTEVTLSPDSSLTNQVVLRKISATYLPNIKRCAAKARAMDASPGTTITATLTIDETGRTVDPGLTGMPEQVAACITRPMATWRFPVAKNADGEPARVTARVMLKIAYHGDPPKADSIDDRIGPAPPPLPDGPKLGMVVSVTRTDVIVWSLSGRESSLKEPHTRIPLDAKAAAELSAVLEEIVKRRWAGKTRHLQDTDIVFMADRGTPMQTVVELLGAVRASPAGTELFPAVLLSAGFE